MTLKIRIINIISCGVMNKEDYDVLSVEGVFTLINKKVLLKKRLSQLEITLLRRARSHLEISKIMVTPIDDLVPVN
jgi:hypothetical protein